MSSDPIPMVAAPFIPVTTPTVERANRLLSVRVHPGFLDVLSLSEEIIQEAVETCSGYPGWDPQVMVVLKVRMQVAKEHHLRLIGKINDAIQVGIAEGRTESSSLPTKTAEESVDQGDLVRQEVLKRFEENDNRMAGSY